MLQYSNMKNIFRIIRDNKILLAFLLLLTVFQLIVMFHILPLSKLDKVVVTAINTLLIIPVAYLLIFGKKYDHYKALTRASLYVIPVFALAILLLYILRPTVADWLAREDFIIENLTALFAVIGSAVLVGVFVQLSRKKQVLPAIFALLISMAFFVIGAEEISWGQRMLDIESSAFFYEHNIQQETNFHNLDTTLTMSMFYILVFVIFTAVSFWNKQTEALLKKLSLLQLKIFIPSKWLILPFAVSIGFVSDTLAFRLDYAIMLVVTILILVAALSTKIDGLSQHKGVVIFTLIVILASLTICSLLDYDALMVQSWFPSEYREFFICLGIMLYSLDLFIRVREKLVLR